MPRQIKPKPQIPTDELIAVIRKGNKSPIRHEAWRYYSILDTLRWYGVSLEEAKEIAKWCGRTHQQLMKITGDISVTLERGNTEQ